MANLFDLCVHVILHSPSLSEKAALHLPKKISHYILYEACQSKNFAAVEKIVEAWSHPTLSLDFLSFPFCRQQRDFSKNYLLAPEYFNVYSSVKLALCITSIAVGLFKNVHRQICHVALNRGIPNSFQLKEVDISRIHASFDDDENESVLISLQRLVAGDFPGTHASDYLHSKDKKALRVARPQLPPHRSNSEQIKLLLSFSLHKMTSLEHFSIHHCTSHFKVVITGLDLLPLRQKSMLAVQLKNLQLCNSSLMHFKIDPSLITAKSLPLLPSLPSSCILSFIVPSEIEKEEEKYAHIFAHLLSSVSVIKAFFTNTSDERVFDALLSVGHCQVTALGIIQPTLSRYESQTNLALVKFLQHNSTVIEYLQLRPFFLTTVLSPLLTQLNCSTLRVLSIDSCGQSSREKQFHLGEGVFNALSNLCNLEYFEWAEVFNLRTVDIKALYHLLSNSLPKLQHWHMYLNRLLLSTTDLDNELFLAIQPLLQPILKGKVGDESCTTYKFPLSHIAFVSWLQTLRSVCFKTGTHRDCPSVELLYLFPWLGYC